MSVRIAPSIAAGDLMNLESEVSKLEASGADSIHFDVMDGHFVPLLTLGVPIIEQMRKITKMHLDVHIMVSNPDEVFEDYISAGADTLTFPVETAKHAHRMCLKIRERGKRAGAALNPGTHWHAVQYLLPVLDQVTIMAVNPGFSRQPHLPEVHPKVIELANYARSHYPNVEIQIDGGVSTKNAGALHQYGANCLVAGGAVFNNVDYAQAIRALKEAAQAL